MGIHKRADWIDSDTDLGRRWWLFECQLRTKKALAVNHVNGSFDECKDWLVEHGIPANSIGSHSSSIIYLFDNEADATMFYLRWGHHGSP